MKWDWGAAFLSELDVVFPYNTHVVIISCKAGKDQLALNAYLVKSEAKKRFGRPTVLPFVALPHNKEFEPVDGVGIVTPSILSDGKKLRASIDGLVLSLQTTSENRKNESPHPKA